MIFNPAFGGGGGEGIPSGIITMWSGAASAIPDGWALCDGSNGTPDLRGKFALGSSDKYAVGATGGEETHTLTVAELASHSHAKGTLSTSNTGSHTHSYYKSYGDQSKDGMRGGTSYVTSSMGTSSASTGSDGSHSHTVSGSTASAGSGTAHNNMPPYYALAYIMKL